MSLLPSSPVVRSYKTIVEFHNQDINTEIQSRYKLFCFTLLEPRWRPFWALLTSSPVLNPGSHLICFPFKFFILRIVSKWNYIVNNFGVGFFHSAQYSGDLSRLLHVSIVLLLFIFLNDIPWYVWSTLCLISHTKWNTWAFSSF